MEKVAPGDAPPLLSTTPSAVFPLSLPQKGILEWVHGDTQAGDSYLDLWLPS